MYRSHARAIAQSWNPSSDINYSEIMNNVQSSTSDIVNEVTEYTQKIVPAILPTTENTISSVSETAAEQVTSTPTNSFSIKKFTLILATSAIAYTVYNIYKNPNIISNIKVKLNPTKKSKRKTKRKLKSNIKPVPVITQSNSTISTTNENTVESEIKKEINDDNSTLVGSYTNSETTTTSTTPINYKSELKLSEKQVKEVNPFIDAFNEDNKIDNNNLTNLNNNESEKFKIESISEDDVPQLEEVKDNENSQESDEYKDLSIEERKEMAKKAKDEGNKYFSSKKYSKALKLYTKAINLNPDSVYYGNRSACWNNLGKMDEVIKDCTEALKLNPNYIKALKRRAQAYEKTSNLREALNDYTALCILDEFSDDSIVNSNENVLKKYSEQVTTEIIKNRKPKLPSITFINAYMDSFRKKEEEYDTSNIWDDSEGDSIYLDAIENTKAKNYQLASEQVDQAIQVGIKSEKMKAGAYRLRGTYLYLSNLLNEAISDLEESLKLDPENIQTHIKLASCLLEKGEIEPSLELFDRAAMISSDDPDLYYHRAHVKFMMNQYQDAIDDYKKSAKIDPSFVFSYIQQGVAYYRLGSTPSAIKTFEDASKKFKNSPDLHNYYGEILMDMKKFDDALEEFDKASKVAPESPFSYVNKAILSMQKMDIVNSEVNVRKALEVDPNCDIAHVHMAQICLQKHDIEEAIEHYEKAIEVARTDMDLQQAVMCKEAAAAQLDVIKKYPKIKEKFFK